MERIEEFKEKLAALIEDYDVSSITYNNMCGMCIESNDGDLLYSSRMSIMESNDLIGC